MQTLATFYGQRPVACYDGARRSSLPPGLTEWAAAPDLPCGTLIEILGPLGSATVPVEDHGPNGWARAAGRGLDLTPGAFARIARLTAGVVPVRYRVVGP